MKTLWLDHWYEDAYAAWQKTGGPWLHGTADYWDVALRADGHDSRTHLINSDPNWQVTFSEFKPDVVCSQSIGRWGAYDGSPLSEFRRFTGCKLVGFCSYRADEQTYLGWDCLFTSFPWLVDHARSLGVRCEYMPLAFGRPVLDRIGELPKERDIPVAFVGGLGSRIWDKGTATMAAIAEAIPEFRWWGYKISDVPESLERTFMGPSWGLDYYRILARTKILVNRHGEIARGFGNNMRQYEAGGMGCLLVTDAKGEIANCFEYTNEKEAISILDFAYCGVYEDKGIEDRFHKDVMENHTYEARVPRFLEVVESL